MSTIVKRSDECIRDEHDNVTPFTKKVLMYGWDSENLEKVRIKTNADGETSTQITSSVLPTGAATSAKQLPDNHNVTVSNIASTPLITGFATSEKQSDGTQISQMYGKTGDSTFQVLRLDTITHTLQTIDYSHHEVHGGKFYRSGMNYTLANGQVATFAITTPNTTEWCHITWELSATADGTFSLLEDVTSFAGGAAVTPMNHNRNSLTNSTMTCLRGMTGADLITPTGGTTILNAVLGTGKGSSTQRGIGEEFILKQNSKYLFRYTNGTSANIIQLACEWYEHTNKTA